MQLQGSLPPAVFINPGPEEATPIASAPTAHGCIYFSGKTDQVSTPLLRTNFTQHLLTCCRTEMEPGRHCGTGSEKNFIRKLASFSGFLVLHQKSRHLAAIVVYRIIRPFYSPLFWGAFVAPSYTFPLLHNPAGWRAVFTRKGGAKVRCVAIYRCTCTKPCVHFSAQRRG